MGIAVLLNQPMADDSHNLELKRHFISFIAHFKTLSEIISKHRLILPLPIA